MTLRNQLQETKLAKAARESAPDAQVVTVTCPACAEQFALNDAILGSLRDDVSREVHAEVRRQKEELAQRELVLRKQQAALDETRAEQERNVQALVEEEIKTRTVEIQAKATKKAAADQETVLAAMREELESKASALKQAREAELQLRREKNEIEEAKANLALEVQRKLDEERAKVREIEKAKADEENRLKIAEREKVISDLREQLQVAQRKADQGSQQAQGEILELDFEQQLRQVFPLDNISEVSKGIRGADLAQEVVSKSGRPCGTILYENKRTKNWSDAWIAKLKEDVREARAEIGVIVTEVLPKGVTSFGQRDGVWVTDFASAIPLAHVLRCTLQEVAVARAHREGAKEKMEVLYEYLTGSEFRQRVQAVGDAFRSMKEDLDQERRALTRSWAKREKYINAVVENMAGMVGDMQAISGNALQAIPALEMQETEEIG